MQMDLTNVHKCLFFQTESFELNSVLGLTPTPPNSLDNREICSRTFVITRDNNYLSENRFVVSKLKSFFFNTILHPPRGFDPRSLAPCECSF